MKIGKIFFVFGLTATTLLSLGNCVSKRRRDPRGDMYAGSDACRSCHPKISSSSFHTAHYQSTQIASAQTMLGDFTPGSNTVQISAEDILTMQREGAGFFQVFSKSGEPVRSGRIDLVMGAVKGQTYLTSTADGYHELPASWLTGSRRWTASPGFSLNRMTFDRPVTKRCFECHSGWMPDGATLSAGKDPAATAVLSIDCERCHGPAAAHVAFHQSHPEEKVAAAIVRIGALTRKQKMDLCATCHSGTRQTMLRSTYSFRPGNSLDSFMIPDFMGTLPVDVHGNQSRLLAASRCFRDPALECGSCHNTHDVSRGEPASYNAKCLQCHTGNHLHDRFGADVPASFIRDRCTACHMPAQPSANITVETSKDSAAMAILVVNHRIAVYPEVSAAMLKKFHP